MKSTNIVSIKYKEFNEKIEYSSNLDQFLNNIKSKFYLDDGIKDQMVLYYLDEDNDQVPIDDNNFDELDEIPQNWVIEKKEDSNGNPTMTQELKEKINDKLNESKKNIIKKSIVLLKKKEEEKDKKHLDEINKIKSDFESAIKEINQKNKTFITNLYEIFEQKLKNCMENYNKKIIELIDKDLNNSQIQQCTTSQNVSSQDFESNMEDIKNLVEEFLKGYENHELENISLFQSSRNISQIMEHCELKIKAEADGSSLDKINKGFSVVFNIKNTSSNNLPSDCYAQGFLDDKLINTINIKLDLSPVKPNEERSDFEGLINGEIFKKSGKYNIKFVIVSLTMGIISNIANYDFKIIENDE